MNSIYLNIFYIFIVIAAVLLVLSIFLFIRFNIPKVIGDITGANSKKAIKKTREINEKSGKKEYKVSKVNQQRGKITDDINNIDKISNKKNIVHGSMSTEDLEIPSQNITENSNSTTVLNNESTTELGDNSTTVLSKTPTKQTTVLGTNENTIQNQFDGDNLPEVEISEFVVEEDISFTESNEVIV